jgi:maltose alpha-D-glucosyltransferase / alpha-amylase
MNEEDALTLTDRWNENAIVYCLDVETYADSNGDGIGDFHGLTERLDYLASLGITALWLMPFYPTPNGDDGYDVSDYGAIDPRLGSMTDFSEFMSEAKERGLRIIIDLVPNHSSDQHPWFQAARADPSSKYRDYYVWRDDDPGDTSDQAVFPDEQHGIWTYDEAVGAYYLHHFYPFQPDLNFANPQVRDEFRKIMGLWLELGVNGFRIDAAPFLINLTGIEGVRDMDVAHHFLQELKDFATVRQGDTILLGEVDTSLATLADYFGGGNELQALFNFPLNRYLFLGLAQESADPIMFGLNQLPTVPDVGQWVNFLRHHDELNLSRLTKEQRQQIFAAFGPEKTMQIYDRGLRRRLAPMLGGDMARIRMAYSLLFSLPGIPVIYYGEEIGMGENLDAPGRLSVRTPMQWTAYNNGGFSAAPPEQFVRPMVTDGDYGFERVSVSALRSDPDSLLNWMAWLIRTRREVPEVGYGTSEVVKTNEDAVLALRYTTPGCTVLIFNNLSGKRRTVEVDIDAEEAATATDLMGDRDYEPLQAGKNRIRFNPYGFRWLRLRGIY